MEKLNNLRGVCTAGPTRPHYRHTMSCSQSRAGAVPELCHGTKSHAMVLELCHRTGAMPRCWSYATVPEPCHGTRAMPRHQSHATVLGLSQCWSCHGAGATLRFWSTLWRCTSACAESCCGAGCCPNAARGAVTRRGIGREGWGDEGVVFLRWE